MTKNTKRRMSHLDAVLFSLETSTNHMHLGLLARFEAAPAGVDIVELLRERLTVGDQEDLRFVVRPSRLGLTPPRLIDKGDVNFSYHLRSTVLATGDDAELDEWIGKELSHSLDRSKPLWQMTVIHGLADGGFAFFVKGHHGVMDGVAAMRMALRILDGEHGVIDERRHESFLAARGAQVSSAVGGLLDVAKWPVRLARIAVDPTRRAVHSAHVPAVPQMFTAPRTPINRTISRERIVRRTQLPLAEVIAARRVGNCTGNDVVVAIVASSVRALLNKRNALPDKPLVAIIPVAQSGEEWRKHSGNRLAFSFVSMATNLARPTDRLAAIAKSSSAGRKASRLRGSDLWERYAGAVLPGIFHAIAAAAERTHLSDHIRPLGSMIVSNITGPRHEMSLGGAKLVGLWPFGPPKDGGAINVTMVSYGDSIYVGVQGDKALADEVTELVAGFAGGLAELEPSVSAGDEVSA